jgi:hypothetical protein
MRFELWHSGTTAAASRWYLIRPAGSGLRSLPHLYGAGDPIEWLVPRR